MHFTAIFINIVLFPDYCFFSFIVMDNPGDIAVVILNCQPFLTVIERGNE